MSWIPKLGSFQAFNNRLNRLEGAFTSLIEMLLAGFQPDDCLFDQSLLDSMSIITCSGKCLGKVSSEIAYKEDMLKHQNSETLAPVKAVKGMADVIKQRVKAADDLF